MIGQIEEAVIALIQAGVNASPGLGYKLASPVTSYGGELDDLTAEQIRAFPAVWVTYGGGGEPKQLNTQGTKWLTPANFVMMFATRNLRSERATRQGLTVGAQVKEVGAYQLIRDVSLMLINNDLAASGVKINPFRPGRIRTLYNTKIGGQAVSAFAREFRTSYVETQPRSVFDPTSADFLSIGMDFYLRPDDGVVDEQSSITLV